MSKLPIYHPYYNNRPKKTDSDIYIPNPQNPATGAPYRNGNYYIVAWMYSALDNLIAAYPDYVSKELLGRDESDTFDIYAYYFTPSNPTGKIIVENGIHCEYEVHTVTGINFFEELCNNYSSSKQLTWLHNNITIVYVPGLNAWGHSNGERRNVNGINPNRQCGYLYSTLTYEPGDDNYQGVTAFSEAENIIIRDLMRTHNDALLYFCVHCEWYGYQLSDNKFAYAYGISDDYTYARWGVQLAAHLLKTKYPSDLTRTFNDSSAGTTRSYAYYIEGIRAILIELQGDAKKAEYTSEVMTRALAQFGNYIYQSTKAAIRAETNKFKPSDVSSLEMWLDASNRDSIIHINNAVSQWNDLSGNNNHATQPSSSYKPTYSQINRSINFLGDYLNINVNAKAAFFVFNNSNGSDYNNTVTPIISDFNGSRSNSYIILGNNTATYSISLDGASGVDSGQSCFNGGNLSPESATTDNINLTGFIPVPTQDELIIGYAQIQNSRNWKYLAGFYGLPSIWKGNINLNEVILLNEIPNEATRKKIEGYLAYKWRINTLLPSTHTYRYRMPGNA